MAARTKTEAEDTTPPGDPAAQSGGIEAGEYITELETVLAEQTVQLVQLRMVNRKLREALAEKRGD